MSYFELYRKISAKGYGITPCIYTSSFWTLQHFTYTANYSSLRKSGMYLFFVHDFFKWILHRKFNLMKLLSRPQARSFNLFKVFRKTVSTSTKYKTIQLFLFEVKKLYSYELTSERRVLTHILWTAHQPYRRHSCNIGDWKQNYSEFDQKPL